MKRLILFLLCLLPAVSIRAQDAQPNPFGVIEGFWLPEEVCELGAAPTDQRRGLEHA